MKKLIFLIIPPVMLLSCSYGFYVYSVVSLPDAQEGTIYINATGLNGNEKDAGNNAAFNAFNAILFTGLPSSPQPAPLIDDEARAKGKCPDIISCFHTFECCNRFVVSTEKDGALVREGKGAPVPLKVKVNLS